MANSPSSGHTTLQQVPSWLTCTSARPASYHMRALAGLSCHDPTGLEMCIEYLHDFERACSAKLPVPSRAQLGLSESAKKGQCSIASCALKIMP